MRLIDGVMFVEIGRTELQVTSEEIELLNMHPKYQVNNTLKLEDFEVDLAIMGCKYRWEVTREEEERLEEEEEAKITVQRRIGQQERKKQP